MDEQVDGRLKKGLAARGKEEGLPSAPVIEINDDPRIILGNVQGNGIETTQEEVEGYYIVKSILRNTVGADDIFLRDAMGYCSVLLDDHRSKIVCRMYFNNPAAKQLEIMSGDQKGKHKIESLNDIYQYAEALKATALEIRSKSKA